MRITADTNLLVRVLVEDDPVQAAQAGAALQSAEAVVLTNVTLCELAWVLSKTYRLSASEIADGIRALADPAKVIVDRPAVEAGLAMLEAGGDFADGVIAHTGQGLGADVFVSFDRKAIKRLESLGQPARVP